MEGAFQYSPFYPMTGNGGGSSPSSTFKISSFESDKAFNEIGTTVTTVTFNWSLINGVPTFQSIAPTVGDLSTSLRTYTLPGQNIATNTNFTLETTDGNVRRTKSTTVAFVRPIFWGIVDNAFPEENEVLGITKRVSDYKGFDVTLNINDAYSCFAAPMANPIIDIKERVFGLSVLNTYNTYNNYYISMLDGSMVPYKLYVKKVPENTSGIDLILDIIF